MPDLIPFTINDTNGDPLLGAVPVFVDYVSRAGVIQSQPTISEIGGGQYGFFASDIDVQNGVAFVIDGGLSADVRYQQGVVYNDSSPFIAVMVNGFDGALYTGSLAPIFATYKDSTGASRSQPTISAIAGNYLFSFAPSVADLLVDVAWTLTSPVDGDLNISAGGFAGVSNIQPAAASTARPATISTPLKPKSAPQPKLNPDEPLRIVTIDVIDRAVRDWFDLTVAAHVISPTSQRHKVPVITSSGERWITSRGKEGIRDKNGVLILPLISIRRVSVEGSLDQSSLGVEVPNIQISKQILGPKTNNLHNLYRERSPVYRGPDEPTVYEVTTIPFPHRATFMYELIVQTQFTSQMNTILQKMFHQMDMMNSFVAPFNNKSRQPPVGEQFEERNDPPSGYCVGYMESPLNDNGNLEEFTDQERIIRYSNSFRVPAVLQLDPDDVKPALKVERTSFRLNLGPEQVTFVETEDELDAIFGKKR